MHRNNFTFSYTKTNLPFITFQFPLFLFPFELVNLDENPMKE